MTKKTNKKKTNKKTPQKTKKNPNKKKIIKAISVPLLQQLIPSFSISQLLHLNILASVLKLVSES